MYRLLTIPVINMKEVPLGELPPPNRKNTKGHKLIDLGVNTPNYVYTYSLVDLAVAGLTAKIVKIQPKSLNDLWVNYSSSIKKAKSQLYLSITDNNKNIISRSLLEWDLYLTNNYKLRRLLVKTAPYTFGGQDEL